MSVTRPIERGGSLGGFAGRLLMLAVMAAVLALVLSHLPLQSPDGAQVSAAPVSPEQLSRAFLPLVTSPGAPEAPSLTIHDLAGGEQGWDWLIETFGAVTLERGAGSASVRDLRAIEGTMALVVHVEDGAGNPLEGVPVVFYWPDAPWLPPEQKSCGQDRGIVLLTKSNGNAEFVMGEGAKYFPPGGGPHAVWVATQGTDCLDGLGWLGGTNHTHLDSVWRMP